jgi:hypothetical protein
VEADVPELDGPPTLGTRRQRARRRVAVVVLVVRVVRVVVVLVDWLLFEFCADAPAQRHSVSSSETMNPILFVTFGLSSPSCWQARGDSRPARRGLVNRNFRGRDGGRVAARAALEVGDGLLGDEGGAGEIVLRPAEEAARGAALRG